MSRITREERDRLVNEAWSRFGEADRRQRLADYRKILSSVEGRRFIIWLKKMAKLEEPLRAHELDAHQLAYRAGMHDVIALMFTSLRAHEPQLVAKAEAERMILEADRRAEIDRISKLETEQED